MRTPEGHTAVVAAHIIPWSVSHNDEVRNGLALCHLCHWSFDRGLLGISGRYLVLASSFLRTETNLPGHLLTLADRKMMGPEEDPLWPAKDNLKWHRRKVFVT
jgi:putative restriction endonuclease